MTTGPSQQPRRLGVRKAIATILAEAPREPTGFARGYTHRELAVEVYKTDEPTTAQLSAVRRASAVLIGEGRAVRDEDDRLGNRYVRGGGYRATGTHVRRNQRGEGHIFNNPIGVVVRRPPSDEDRAARADVLARVRAGA